tara:strand:- start:21371 stop:21535 length:165 start_codon:yes stop_codon:yes gene_type:complete
MNQYEIFYKHTNMNPDYTGYTTRWANDEKAVKKLITKNKPYIKITAVNEISKPK